jgi:hypothetical protein
MGSTESSDFPTTLGAFDTTFNGGTFGDYFVCKLDATGTSLIYSTFLGGSDMEAKDDGGAITLDSPGNAYITGETASPDFPATPGALCPTLNGMVDIFFSKLNPDGTSMLYSTYIGGHNFDNARSIDIDADLNIYIAGFTVSPDFPTTPGAFKTVYPRVDSVYALKMAPTPTSTWTATVSPTISTANTPTITPTRTPTNTMANTPTASNTFTQTATGTLTNTPTPPPVPAPNPLVLLLISSSLMLIKRKL